jgi:hypothetical protein
MGPQPQATAERYTGLYGRTYIGISTKILLVPLTTSVRPNPMCPGRGRDATLLDVILRVIYGSFKFNRPQRSNGRFTGKWQVAPLSNFFEFKYIINRLSQSAARQQCGRSHQR